MCPTSRLMSWKADLEEVRLLLLQRWHCCAAASYASHTYCLKQIVIEIMVVLRNLSLRSDIEPINNVNSKPNQLLLVMLNAKTFCMYYSS